LEAPGFNPCAYEVKTWFQAFAFECNLCRYTAAFIHQQLLPEPRFWLAVMLSVGLYTFNPVYPSCLKAPGDPTLEPIK
jgi:hypothetical protein